MGTMRDGRSFLCLLIALGGGGCGVEPGAAPEVSRSQAPIEHPQAEGRSTTTVALSYRGAIECSGTLIGADAVLTAAHCVHRSAPDAIVRFDGTRLRIDRVVVHPRFELATLAHDVAVLRLSTLAFPPYASLGSAGTLSVGDEVTVAGVAAPRALDTTGNYLGTSTLGTVDEARLTLTPSPTSPCGGDSGGSVFSHEDPPRTLLAVISSGDVDCSRISFATRVDTEAIFIDQARTDGPHGGCAVANFARSGAPGVSASGAWLGLALSATLVSWRRRYTMSHARKVPRARRAGDGARPRRGAT